jgi:hypothetical protein
MKRGEFRAKVPVSVNIAGDVKLTATGAVRIFGTDFFPAAFMLEANGKVIYFDPVLVYRPAQAVAFANATRVQMAVPMH